MSDDFHVAFEHVALAFGARRVFSDLSCGFPRGKITSLLGPSGTGKSTVLRLIGRLLRPNGGVVRVDGRDVSALEGGALRELRKGIGMTFQAGALLDSLTVFENVLVGAAGSGEPILAHPFAGRGGLGVMILSTPQGVMSDHAARDANVGGEILCRVF